MKQPTETRSKILQAAHTIVLTEGVAALTLDAAARKAGVSKGGLLYHFPSKEALVAGMVDVLSEEFTSALTSRREADGDGSQPGGWPRAYARATFETAPAEFQKASALLAAVATNPELLDPLRERYKQWQHLLTNDGIDPAIATIIRLAVDGFWLADLLGLAPLTEPLRSQVLQALVDLSRAHEAR